MIPVVFIHRGGQEYLSIALEQAAIRNGVVLLGDNDTLWRNYDPIDDLLAGARDFDQAYVHMSTNPEPFERFCFHRWFALAEWMRKMRAERVFYCDSDVMLYCDVTEWAESVGNPDVSLQIPKHQPDYRWGVSAHVSLWTLGALEKFCDFVLMIYQSGLAKLEEKWRWHEETGRPGGICDMTLLYLWNQCHMSLSARRILNNAMVIDGTTFDHNINVAENYELDEYKLVGPGLRKSLLQQMEEADGYPAGTVWGWNEKLGESIRFNALHFQGGPTKELMKEYKG